MKILNSILSITASLKKINKIQGLLILLIIATLTFGTQYFFQAQFSNFNDEVTFGIYGFVQNERETDYQLWIDYTSKGAFMAGEKIHINAKLYLNNDSLNNSNFIVTFPNSLPEPIVKDNFPFPVSQIDLKFIDEKNATGSVDIIYPMSGEYTHNIIVIPSSTKNINYLGNPIISIAPSETRLQIQNNDRMLRQTYSMLGLTYFILSFMLLQILLSIRKK